MGGLIKGLSKLFTSLFPIIEIIVLSYGIGIAFYSVSASIIAFILLVITSFTMDVAGRLVAWGVVSYFLSSNGIDSVFVGILPAFIIMSIRYAVWKLLKI